MAHIVTDVETTGLTTSGPEPAEVIQIGAYFCNQETMAPTDHCFQVKMKIEHPDRIMDGTLGVYNHYDEAVWDREAVPQAEGWQLFNDWLFGCTGGGQATNVLVGYNFPKFDWQLIAFWSKRFGIDPTCDHNVLDILATFNTWKMVTGSTTRNLSLRTAAIEMEVENPNPHDGLCDAWTEAMVYSLLLNDMKARIQCGPGYTDAQYLDEAYRRIGAPRNGNPGLPLAQEGMEARFRL